METSIRKNRADTSGWRLASGKQEVKPMRQHLFRIYREKLQSRRAETLAELLVSVLVIVLALTMFASALMAARRMLANGDQIINRYYAGRNRLELEESADTDPGAYKTKADLIFRLEEGANNKVTGFAHRNGTMNVGEYPVSLYSGQDLDDADEKTQKTESEYRYSRQ